MKKVFGLFLSLIVLMGLGSCKKGHSVLTFVSSEDSIISLEKEGEPLDISLEYSLDGKNWKPYAIGETLTLADGRELSFRAGEQGNNYFSYSNEEYYYFYISGSVAVKGNIMSLLDRKCSRNSVPSFAFYNLFYNCMGLTSAPSLPATELAEGCYSCMFYNCFGLTEAPALPATKLAKGCYSCMFYNCMNLTEAPALPATELAEWCYSGMFYGCMSLTKAPDLPATKLAEQCYNSIFYDCMSLNYVKALFTDKPSINTTYLWLNNVARTGTFVKSKDARWKNCGIPEGWTIITE